MLEVVCIRISYTQDGLQCSYALHDGICKIVLHVKKQVANCILSSVFNSFDFITNNISKLAMCHKTVIEVNIRLYPNI